jgi:hypothetical protein
MNHSASEDSGGVERVERPREPVATPAAPFAFDSLNAAASLGEQPPDTPNPPAAQPGPVEISRTFFSNKKTSSRTARGYLARYRAYRSKGRTSATVGENDQTLGEDQVAQTPSSEAAPDRTGYLARYRAYRSKPRTTVKAEVDQTPGDDQVEQTPGDDQVEQAPTSEAAPDRTGYLARYRAYRSKHRIHATAGDHTTAGDDDQVEQTPSSEAAPDRTGYLARYRAYRSKHRIHATAKVDQTPGDDQVEQTPSFERTPTTQDAPAFGMAGAEQTIGIQGTPTSQDEQVFGIDGSEQTLSSRGEQTSSGDESTERTGRQHLTLAQVRAYRPKQRTSLTPQDEQTQGEQTPSAPAGWRADPSNRHQFRYWDGFQWTDHVADAGKQTRDAVDP